MPIHNISRLNQNNRKGLLHLIRHSALRSLNRNGHFMDVRKFYACGYVSLSVLKYLDSADDKYLTVDYKSSPLSNLEAARICQDHFGASRVKHLPRSSVASIEPSLRFCGEGTICMLGAAYDPKKSKEFGIIPRVWSHWFNLVYVNGKTYTLDAWSPAEYDKSQDTESFLNQFQKYETADAIMIMPKSAD